MKKTPVIIFTSKNIFNIGSVAKGPKFWQKKLCGTGKIWG
jgi:hypothetical protein